MRSIQARIFRHRPVAKLLLTAALGALPLAGCAVDDGAALNPERVRRGAVVREREGRRRIALVGDQRKAMVDDVEVAVEQPPTTAHRPDCQAFCRTWTARLASRSLFLAA